MTMTARECYVQMGADYDAVLRRLPSEVLIVRLMKKFPDDPSFPELQAAMDAQDAQAAFRAVHTLKGVCLNLGFDALGAAASKLTELLRGGALTGAEELFAQVRREYDRTLSALGMLD